MNQLGTLAFPALFAFETRSPKTRNVKWLLHLMAAVATLAMAGGEAIHLFPA
jgi:hypothetical protein